MSTLLILLIVLNWFPSTAALKNVNLCHVTLLSAFITVYWQCLIDLTLFHDDHSLRLLYNYDVCLSVCLSVCLQSRCIDSVQSRNLAATTGSALLDDGSVITMTTVEMGLMRETVVSSSSSRRIVSDVAHVAERRARSGELSLACSWRVTIYMRKLSAAGQLTRPTQPFIFTGSINE